MSHISGHLRMAKDIAKQLEKLADLGRQEIEALWAELFGRALKAPSRREFLVLILAYRLQEKAYGGLSAATRKRLRSAAAEIEDDPNAEFLAAPRIKPGARLIREWQGKTHKVTVIEDGFVYDGQRYKSLSEIARLITGTRWSGPVFFGLKSSTGRAREARHAG